MVLLSPSCWMVWLDENSDFLVKKKFLILLVAEKNLKTNHGRLRQKAKKKNPLFLRSHDFVGLIYNLCD